MKLQILFFYLFRQGVSDSNTDENSVLSSSTQSTTSKAVRPSLAKIILSQDTDISKQQALGYILTALQILYSRYGENSSQLLSAEQDRKVHLEKKIILFYVKK